MDEMKQGVKGRGFSRPVSADKSGDFALFHAHYAYALTRGFDLGLKAYYRNEQQRYVYG